ncbi:hypothetical protein H0R92_04460 [Treponema sp. OMZ 840]|uniref:FlgD immunoglobulin-like domain containing protein n=1 Tax=Treponema sp. OMZ 840 TaxID=244313 RepID=UPI003D8E0716
MVKGFKSLFTISIILFSMTAGFAADFTWNGSQSSAWNNRSNWTPPVGLPSSDPGYPDDSSDTAIITSNGTSPILNSSIDINSLIINSGTLTIQGNITLTLSGNFTNNGGTFIANTGTVKLNSSGYDIQINGTTNTNNTQFHHLLMEVTDGISKTLTIKNKIKINGDLSLKGSATDRVLVIKGSADIGSHEITLTANNTKEGYNLKVYDNIIITTRSYITNQSKPEPQTSSPSGWIFKDCTSLMTWTAGASSAADKTKWDNYDNWKPKGVPGINTPVEIPYLTSNEYPKLENSTNAQAQSVTVVSGAELDLQHFVIKKGSATAKLTNNGTIKMTGTGDQSDWFTATAPNEKIILGDTSTVEYNAPPPSAANVWAGPYENLKVSGSRHSLSASSITVRKNFTVNSSGLTQTGGNFFFSGNGSGTIDGTGTINFHDLTVTSGRTVKLNKAITVNGNFTNNSGATFNANGKNVTIGGNFTNNNIFTTGFNTVAFNGASIISGNGAISFHNLTVANNKSVTLNKDLTVGGNFTNNSGATFNANGKTVTFTGSNSQISGNGAINFHNLTIASGTLTLGKAITVNGAFTNNGTFNAGTHTVTLAPPPGGTVTITGTGNAGNTTFNNLSLTGGGGKTLTVNGKVSVNGNLTLEGSGSLDAQLLTVQGGTNSPGIQLNINKSGGKWLKVHTNIPMIPESGGHTYTVTESKAEEIPGFPLSGGHPKNWIFTGYAGTLTWKGNHSSNWNDWQNWRPYGTPGVNSVVIIEKKPTSPPPTHYYPKLTGNVSAKTVTVNSGAELDLDGHIIQDGEAGSAVTAHITNNGILKMIGTTTGNPFNPGQKEWLEINNSGPNNNNITHGPDSTMEYYGNTNNAVWTGPYKNLTLSDGRTVLTPMTQGASPIAAPLAVEKTFTVASNAGNNVTVSAASQSYGGTITLNKKTTFNSSVASGTGTVFNNTVSASGVDIVFSGNGPIQTKKTVTARNITVNSGTGAWTSTDTINASGDITVNSGTGAWTSSGGTINARDITVYRGWTANSVVLPGRDLTVEGTWSSNGITAGRHIIARGNWTSNAFVMTHGNITADNASHDNTWTAGDVTLKGSLTAAQFNQTSGTLTFNGTGTPEQELKFTGAGNKNIRNLTVDNGITPPASNAKVKLLSPVMIAGNFTNKGTFNANGKDISLDGSFTNSGIFNTGTGNSLVFNSTFTNNGTFNADADTIVFTGNTFTNSGTFIAGANNTVNLSPSGNIAITGTGNAGNTTFNNLSLTGGGGKTLTVNGKISVSGDLTLEGSGSLDAQLLTVQGGTNSPGIQLNIDKSGGKWLKVHTNIPMIPESGGHTYRVTESKAEEIPGFPLSGGHPKNWIFTGYAGTLTWKGNHSSNWNDWQNWRPYGTPGVNSVVIIEKKPTSPPPTHYYPKLTGNVSAKSVTVNSSAELDLGGEVINKNGPTAKLTNYGTIKLTGKTPQAAWFGAGNDDKIDLKAGSTVVYYGGATDNVWGGPYKKLEAQGRNFLKTGNLSLTVDEDFTVTGSGTEIDTGTAAQTYNGEIKASGHDITFKTSAKLTTNKITAQNITADNGTTHGTAWDLNGNITASGDITIKGWCEASDKTIEASGKITVDTHLRTWGNVTAGNLIKAKEIKFSNGKITAKNGLECTDKFYHADGGTLLFTGNTNQTLKVGSASEIRELEIDSGITLNLLSNIKITYKLTNKGTFHAGNYTVTLDEATPMIGSGVTPPDNITITGTSAAANTQFKDLICTEPYIKTLTINNKISVTGNMTLKGASEASPLTVQGGMSNSEITLNGHKTGGTWLKVKTNIPIADGGSYIAAASKPDPANAPPRNWIFTNAFGQVVWKGNVNTNWNTAGNWEPPYAAPSEHVDVLIKSGANHPVLQKPTLTNPESKAKTVTVQSGAKLDLGDWTIQTSGGSTAQLGVESGGHLLLKGSADQKVWFEQTTPANKMTVQSGSTVEYNGNPSSPSDVWQGPYPRLIVSGNKTSFNNANSLTVNETFAVNTAGALTVTAPIQTYKGAVTLNKDTTFNASNSVTFEQNADIQAAGKTLTVQGNLKLNCAAVTAGSISVSGITEAGAAAPTLLTITAGTQTYGGAVSLKKNVKFAVPNGTITFKSDIIADDGSNKKDIEIEAATVKFSEKTLESTPPSTPLPSLPSVTVNKLTLKAAKVFSYAEISAQNAVEFDVSGSCVIRGPVKAGSFTQKNADCNLQIGAPVTDFWGGPLAAGTFKVASKRIYITHFATLDPSSTAWTRPSDASFFIATNISLANPLSCANFVLFAGTVTMGAGCTGITAESVSPAVKGDIVLFGQNYSPDDTATSDPSGVNGLFTYNHSRRTGMTAAPSVVLPSALPDETVLPGDLTGGKYSGSFADLSVKTFKAGKNFYANGMTLTPAGAWTLDIPDNGKATDSFAEAYFTTVKKCTVSGGGFVAAAEGCTDQNDNSGWDFGRPTITEAYTVSDDTIYVKFNKKIENSNNEIDKALTDIKYHNGSLAFVKAYTVNPSAGSEKTLADVYNPTDTAPYTDMDEFFLRITGERWNTDATGMYVGSSDSTDRGSYTGTQSIGHRSKKPNLSIPKARSLLYATLRDEHKNRIRHYAGSAANTSGANGVIYGDVKDKCPPVLAAVYTGQEQHTQNPASQPSADAHNFIEFRFSEPVYIGGSSTTEDIPESTENKLVTNTIGELVENPAPGFKLRVSGIADIQNGKIKAGLLFTPSSPLPVTDQPHTLYRRFAVGAIAPPTDPTSGIDNRPCRLRLSIAGYTDGTVSVNGVTHKKWIGYIKEAATPSGTVKILSASDGGISIRARNNRQEIDRTVTRSITTSGGLNGSWDTSPPVFAKVSHSIGEWTNTGNQGKEIAAYSSSSQFADKIEFHFFDNTPLYNNSEPWWKTAAASATNPGWSSVNDRYDSYGGSRFTGYNRTTGGIRACTLPPAQDVQHVFSFSAANAEFNPALLKFTGLDTSFTLSLAQKVENQALFGPRPSGFFEQDSLYLQLKITPTGVPLAFPVTEAFTVGYQAFDSSHPNGGRITDLAGNIMKSVSGGTSIDASPPNIALTVAPVESKHMYVLFTSQIDTRPETLAKIPHNLAIIDLPSGPPPIQIDSRIPARVRTDTKKGTGIIVSLTGNVNYAALSQAKLQVKTNSAGLIDIVPKYGGFPAFAGHKHVISDFAVNVVRPLFAYDEKTLDDGSSGFATEGVYGGTSPAVRLFDGSGAPGNTVLEKEDITVHLTVENMNLSDLPQQGTFKMFIDNDPLPSSVSTALNSVTNLGSRVWFPALSAFSPPLPSSPTPTSILPVISETGNNLCEVLSPETPFAGQPQGLYIFKLLNNPASPGSLNYPAGSRAGFLFPMINAAGAYIMIDPDCDGSDPVPLYALRLKDPKDPASIDLWSLDIAAVKQQAGGVSVLNNVINTNTKEQCLIHITAKQAGSLNVIAMTLDGDVVKVLYSGRVEKGEHIYKWDGTNSRGDAVARGLYFIRVVGPNIDETRKVMAIRD